MREDVIRAHAELAVAMRAHPPAAAVGLEPGAQADAAHLHPRALPRPRRADPRARPRLRADHRHHRRLSRARPRPTSSRRSRSPRQVGYDGAFTFIYSPRRGTEAATLPDQLPHEVKVERMERLVEVIQRRGTGARAAVRRAARSRCSSRGRRGPTPAACGAARATTRSSTSTGLGSPGDLVEVQITAATSQTLWAAKPRCWPSLARLTLALQRPALTSGGVCEHTFVRWSNLSTEAEERARLPGYRDDVVVRHFEAPDAISTRFYEVRAKSILNRVPEASRMPFRWTINPYRGCSHACAYCMSGDTRVLGADGREIPTPRARRRSADLRDHPIRGLPEVRADGGDGEMVKPQTGSSGGAGGWN